MFIKDLTVENFNWSITDYKAVHDYRLLIKSLIWDEDFSQVSEPSSVPGLSKVTKTLQRGTNPGEYLIDPTDDIVTPDILPGCTFTVAGFGGARFKRDGTQLCVVLQGSAAPWPTTVSATYWVYTGIYKNVGIALNSTAMPHIPQHPQFLFDLTNRQYDLMLNPLYAIPPAPTDGDDKKVLTIDGADLTWQEVNTKPPAVDGTIIMTESSTAYNLKINSVQFLQSLTIGENGSPSAYVLPTAAPSMPNPGQSYGLSFTAGPNGGPQIASWANQSGILMEWQAGQFSSVKVGSSAANYQLPLTMPSAAGLSYLTYNNGSPGWGSVQIATGNSVFQSGNGITVNQTTPTPGGGNVFTFDLNSSARFTNLSIGTALSNYLLPTAPAPFSTMFMITDDNCNPQWRGISTGPGLSTAINSENLTFSFDPIVPIPELNINNLGIYTSTNSINGTESAPGNYYKFPPPYSGASPAGKFLCLDSFSNLNWLSVIGGNNINVISSDNGITVGLADSISLNSGDVIISSQTVKLGSYTLPPPNGTYDAGKYLKYNGGGICSWADAPSGGDSTDPITIGGTANQIIATAVPNGYVLSLPEIININNSNNILQTFISPDGLTSDNVFTNMSISVNNKDSSFNIVNLGASIPVTIINISKDTVKLGNYTLPSPSATPPPDTYLKHTAGGVCAWSTVSGGTSTTVNGVSGQITSTPSASGYTVGLASAISGINSILLDSGTNSPAIKLTGNRITRTINTVETLFTPSPRYAPIEEARRINGISLIMPVDDRYVKLVTSNTPDLTYALTPDISNKYNFILQMVAPNGQTSVANEADYMFTVADGKCSVISSNGLGFGSNYQLTYYVYQGNSLLHGSKERHPTLQAEPQAPPEPTDIDSTSLVYGTSNDAQLSLASTVCGINNVIYPMPATFLNDNGYIDQRIIFLCVVTGAGQISLTSQEPAIKYGLTNLAGCLGLHDTSPAPAGADFKLYSVEDNSFCGVLIASSIVSTLDSLTANYFDQNLTVENGKEYYITFKVDSLQYATINNTVLGNNNRYVPINFGSSDELSGAATIVGNGNINTGSINLCLGNVNVVNGAFNTNVGISNNITGTYAVVTGANNEVFNSGDVVYGHKNVVQNYKNSLLLDGRYLTDEYAEITNNNIFVSNDPAQYVQKIYSPFSNDLTITSTVDGNERVTALRPTAMPDGSIFYIKTILDPQNPILIYPENGSPTPLVPETGFSYGIILTLTLTGSTETTLPITRFDAYQNSIILTTADTIGVAYASMKGYHLTKYVEYTSSAIIGKSNTINVESANIIGTRNTVVNDKPSITYPPDDDYKNGAHYIAGNENTINAPSAHNNIIMGYSNGLNNCKGTALINCNKMTINDVVNTTFVGFNTTPSVMPPSNCVAVPSLQMYGSLYESWEIVTNNVGNVYVFDNFNIQNLYIKSTTIDTLSISPPNITGFNPGWKLNVRLNGRAKGSQFTIYCGGLTTIETYSGATQASNTEFYTTSTEVAHIILNSPIITLNAYAPLSIICENS